MKHLQALAEKAVILRRRGFSYREISEELHVSKSTTYVWTHSINLSEAAVERITRVRQFAREKGWATVRKKLEKHKKEVKLTGLKPGASRLSCA